MVKKIIKQDLEIVNVVCSGEIPVEESIDLEAVVELLNAPSKPYGISGKVIELEEGEITLYKNGNFIIRSKSKEALEKTLNSFISKLSQIGIDYTKTELYFHIDTICASGKLYQIKDNDFTSWIATKLYHQSFFTLEEIVDSNEYILTYRRDDTEVSIDNDGNVILIGRDEDKVERNFTKLVEELRKVV